MQELFLRVRDVGITVFGRRVRRWVCSSSLAEIEAKAVTVTGTDETTKELPKSSCGNVRVVMMWLLLC
jgi:hypothetical protein